MKTNSMNNRKKNSKKKFLLITLAVILILAAIGVLYFVNHHSAANSADKTSSGTGPTKSTSDINQANNIQTNPTTKETTPNTDTATPPKTDASTGKSVAQMVTSVSISSGTVYIRGGINNFSVSDGNCYATLTGPNGQTITKNTTLLQNASTTDCKTITISTSQLTPGQWKYSLNYSSNTIEGKTDEAIFTVN